MDVRLLNCAYNSENGTYQGTLDPRTYDGVEIGPYQREVLDNKVKEIVEELEKGALLPPIMLVTRGNNIHYDHRSMIAIVREIIRDVDGQQRLTACKEYFRKTGKNPQLSFLLETNVSEERETEIFLSLNTTGTRLKAGKIIKEKFNLLNHSKALVALTETRSFPLFDRVCWGQLRSTKQVLTGAVFVKVCAALHSRYGFARTNKADDLAEAVEKMMVDVTPGIFLTNVKVFFQLVERVWGFVKKDEYGHTMKRGVPQITGGFLITLATVFSEHEQFWEGRSFKVPSDLESKLAQYINTQSAEMIHMVKARGSSPVDALYERFVSAMDYRRSTNKLRKFSDCARKTAQPSAS